MTKTKEKRKIVYVFSIIFTILCYFVCGCALKGSIDKNFICSNLDSNNRCNITISKTDTTYSGVISLDVSNTSSIDYTHVTIKFAVYDSNRSLITTVSKSLGKVGHLGSTAQDETGASTKAVKIEFSVKTNKDYDLSSPFYELIYLAGWKGL